MQFNYDELAPLRKLLATEGVSPPVAAIAGMRALIGDAEPVAAIVGRTQSEGATAWRAAALAGGRIAYVHAERSQPGWDFGDGPRAGDDATGWIRRVSQVSALELAGVEEMEGYGADLEVIVRAAIVFDDQLRLDLPLFSPADHRRYDRSAVEAFISAVRAECNL